MIAYFDTSAVVPLLIAERGSDLAVSMWERADRVVTVRLTYPECRAALARSRRLGRLTTGELRGAVQRLDERLDDVDLIEVDAHLAHRAGELAETRSLRGYDAVHLAAAERVRDGDLVVVSGEADLLAAASAEGMATSAVHS